MAPGRCDSNLTYRLRTGRWSSILKNLIIKHFVVGDIQGWGTRTWYSYSQYLSTEFLVLILYLYSWYLYLILVLVDKYWGTHTSTGPSTDIPCYICDTRVKPSYLWNKVWLPKFQIDLFFLWFDYMIHGMWLQIPQLQKSSLNFIIIKKFTELIWRNLCLSLSFVQVHFPIQLLVNVEKNFTADLRHY